MAEKWKFLSATGIPFAEEMKLGLPPDQIFEKDGKVWLAVETTLLAKSFHAAVARGAHLARGKVEEELLIENTWDRFAPVTLNLAAPMPNEALAWERYRRTLKEFAIRK